MPDGKLRPYEQLIDDVIAKRRGDLTIQEVYLHARQVAKKVNQTDWFDGLFSVQGWCALVATRLQTGGFRLYGQRGSLWYHPNRKGSHD